MKKISFAKFHNIDIMLDLVTRRNFLLVASVAVGSEAIRRLCLRFYKYLTTKPKQVNQVIFFPDSPSSPGLTRLLELLGEVEGQLDLCLFLFTCPHLARGVMGALKRGVRVRLVTEQSNIGVAGCQVAKLREAGVFIESRVQPSLMHHKFAVLDNKLVITGSFNWTGQAVLGNNENLVISTDPGLVLGFVGEFERLWRLIRDSRGEVK